MARRARGVAVVENSQTGDGRVIASSAVTWAEPPLPLAWLKNEQHGDLLDGGVQVGTVDTITRTGDQIEYTATIDDQQPDGAELVRRLEAGTASLGVRTGVSIDPDDWALQVISTVPMDEDAMMILASMSGSGPLPSVRSLAAAAGDPDPGDGSADGTDLIWEDAADQIVARFTRLRMRGLTCCAVAAFTECYLELEPADAAATADDTAPVAAAVSNRPPRDWFYTPEPELGDERLIDQYDERGNHLGVACPLTITDDGQVYGHLAASWAQCHVGIPGTCVGPPSSPTNYAHYHIGSTVTADGTKVATGPLVVGCDHAAASMLAPEARDFYAHAGLQWASGRASDGVFAPWFCGALMPGLSDDVIRVLRATTLSGDWRGIGGHLELIVGLSVNGPGFPVAREALAASGVRQVATVGPPEAHIGAGGQVSLVAARPASRCRDCHQRHLLASVRSESYDEALRLLRVIELRTRPMDGPARDHLMASIRGLRSAV